MQNMLAVGVVALLPSIVAADYIETSWRIENFTGDAAFLDASDVIGQLQVFEGGFADGPLYQCDFAGQYMTYSTYETAAFLANPAFSAFEPVREAISRTSTKVFVHRISCNGGGDDVARKVLYPFVTVDNVGVAWYPFEGGVFSLVSE
jgi:hypothetical protein